MCLVVVEPKLQTDRSGKELKQKISEKILPENDTNIQESNHVDEEPEVKSKQEESTPRSNLSHYSVESDHEKNKTKPPMTLQDWVCFYQRIHLSFIIHL